GPPTITMETSLAHRVGAFPTSTSSVSKREDNPSATASAIVCVLPNIDSNTTSARCMTHSLQTIHSQLRARSPPAVGQKVPSREGTTDAVNAAMRTDAVPMDKEGGEMQTMQGRIDVPELERLEPIHTE